MTSDFKRALRREYGASTLEEEGCCDNPFEQFKAWFDLAMKHESGEVNAMSVSTATEKGVSSRMVLLKDLSESGFVFFTNYLSRKGQEIDRNPQVALLFYWPLLERQVRIEGRAVKISNLESDRYFAERPRKSQVGAVASQQSRLLPSRDMLEKKVTEVEQAAGSGQIERPKEWGGYEVRPDYFEFWQGREDRLHDRILYELNEGRWAKARLYP